MVLIYIGRGLEYKRGLVFYPWVETDEAGIQDVIVDLH